MDLFKYFIPSSGKKTDWKHVIDGAKTDQDVTTTSNEAFTLLVLENHWDRWVNIFNKSDGHVVPTRGKKSVCVSNILPKYTRGGILFDARIPREDGKGWSALGIRRFNELFDQVKENRRKHPDFIGRFLEQE